MDLDLRETLESQQSQISRAILCMKTLRFLRMDVSALRPSSLEAFLHDNTALYKVTVRNANSAFKCNNLPNLTDALCASNQKIKMDFQVSTVQPTNIRPPIIQTSGLSEQVSKI